MSSRQWEDPLGNERSSPDSDSDAMWGAPDEGSYASEDEWLEELLEEVSNELSDLADLRRTGDSILEGEVDADLWLTLDFQLSALPGPTSTEAIMTCTVEGAGESVNGQAEFEMEDDMLFVREHAREQVEETMELHPASHD